MAEEAEWVELVELEVQVEVDGLDQSQIVLGLFRWKMI